MTAKEIIFKWFLVKKEFIRIYSILLVLIGLAYILAQNFKSKEILDATFVGLLLGGSFILIFGAFWIHNFFKTQINEFEFQIIKSNGEQKTNFYLSLSKIFSRKSIIVGVFYGLSVGCMSFIYDLWPNETLLKLLLVLFLFIVNFLTGIALTTLFRIFQFLYFSAKCIEFNLYDVKHLTKFITTLSKSASIIAAFYVFFSIMSIYFSILPLDFLTIGYSVFATLVIISAYIIPIIPINNKTKQLKNDVLKTISTEIQSEFNLVIDDIDKVENLNLEKYDNLIEIRKKVESIQTIPIGMKAVWNSLSIIAITLLPILLQFILEKLAS